MSPNPTQLIRDAAPIEERPVVEGYVATTRPAPTTYTEGVWVVLPEFSTTALIGPLQWGAIHGTTKPAQGAAVQVGMDLITNEPRVIWWEGTYKEPGGAGGGVESVFGRTGKVVAKSGDYSVGEVTNAASKAEVTASVKVETERAEGAEASIESELDLIEEGTTDLAAYLRLLGRSGGQKAIGGTAASNALELESTSNATKGKILFGSYAAFNEEAGISAQRRFGLGTQAPTAQFHQVGEQPAEVGTSPGTTPANVLTVTGAKGGNTSIATTGSGAKGAEGIITAGEGGEAPSAAAFSGGGAGGKLEVAGGKGGKPNATATESRAGGAGGALTFKGGAGAGATTGGENARGGKGGAITFTGGAGGASSKGTVLTEAGAGGAIEFTAGSGGGATTGTETNGGAGGRFQVKAGNGGTGTSSGGAGGELVFGAGGGSVKGAGGAVTFRGGTSAEGTGGSIVFETGNSSVSTIMQLTAGAAIGFYSATPVTRHAAIAAVTNPGTFKAGAHGFEAEAEAKAVIEKLEGLTTAVNELREAIKKIGITE